MPSIRPFRSAILAALLLLSACESPEERAQRHYQAGVAYLQQGDVDRALVEFRNVFKLDGKHREARIAYAEAERGRGNLREAFSQYLRLLEQYPQDKDALRALVQMAADNGQWDDALKYSAEALQVTPADAEMQALKIYADYGIALAANDSARVVSALSAAKDLRQRQPQNLYLARIIIDDLIRAQFADQALAELNAAIALAPKERLFYAQRLSIYA
ncbi:MAG: tetratricopeptide repeat protein, partial [Rhodobacteraceae bacterium]|nr:tetratricopeptide repeat protein [Paracoccaceae bacterium]